MIKVLVVEDSPVLREFLVAVLSSDPELQVIGTASNGEEAIDAVTRQHPDVVTMDIHMPKMNGLEATRRIMESCPTPIVIVSGSNNQHEVVSTFDALEAGALAVMRRPAGLGHDEHEHTVSELRQTIKLMSEIRVVRRWPKNKFIAMNEPASEGNQAEARLRIVAIGASTGGPPVLQTILAALPGNFPAPIVIVQHMASGFSQGFMEWLAHYSALPVHLASHGEILLPGHVYLAPDDKQMKVSRNERIVLTDEPPENGLRPAVSCLFRSVAESYGNDAVAGLLTGMGRDGAEELHLLKQKGAITFAQDKDSSVVHGMPGEAIRLDAALLVLPPEKIATILTSLANNGLARWRNS